MVSICCRIPMEWFHFINQVRTLAKREPPETVSVFGMRQGFPHPLLQKRAPSCLFTRIEPKNQPHACKQLLAVEHTIAATISHFLWCSRRRSLSHEEMAIFDLPHRA